MYKMDEDLKEDYTTCDYFSNLIKKSIKDLRVDGVCYVFSQAQVDEIVKYMKVPVNISKNECGYTLKIKRNKRDYVRKENIYE